MKKYFFFAAAALALASCSSDDFVGTGNTGNNEVDNAAINFNSGTNKVTRSTKTGAAAASDLNNNFVVFGYKTTGTNKSTVYDHYNVNYIAGSEGQTESNTKGWEYVGQQKNSLNTVADNQTIKYWDYSADQYDFVAFSFGTAVQGTATDKTGKVVASTVDQTPKYTLEGSVDDLAKCYISDRATAKKTATTKVTKYGEPVTFNFRSLKSQVQLAIYETVPGYSIKDVVYYSGNDTKLSGSDNIPTLYDKDGKIPAGDGTMTITFPQTDETKTDFNQAKVEWNGSSNTSTINWDKLGLKNAESKEATGEIYLGRDITNKSASGYKNVLPGTEVKELTLKVDYTLVSTDGSGETIKVTGAKATIPDVYTQWKPNYSYTYIFKISDKTNGGTGGSTDPKGLYPITFDAVVTETETGQQNTITTVEDNSITTYAKGAVGEEYKEGDNIYVSVGNNLALHVADAEGSVTKNIALYTVTASGYPATEANVALALKNGTQTGNTWKLTEDTKSLTVETNNTIALAAEIAAGDAVDGNAISGNFAKFTAAANTIYAVEYTAPDGKKYYKVIIVK